jgi:hypothetical protein
VYGSTVDTVSGTVLGAMLGSADKGTVDIDGRTDGISVDIVG